MSIEAQAFVWDVDVLLVRDPAVGPTVDPLGKHVLNCYANYADEHGATYVGSRTVAKKTHLARSTVEAVRDLLMEAGYLQLVRIGGGKSRPSVYRIVMDRGEIPVLIRPESRAVSPEGTAADPATVATIGAPEPADARGPRENVVDDVHTPPVDGDGDEAGGPPYGPTAGPFEELYGLDTACIRPAYGPTATPGPAVSPPIPEPGTGSTPPTPPPDVPGVDEDGGRAAGAPPGEDHSNSRVQDALSLLAERDADRPGALDGYRSGRAAWVAARRHELFATIGGAVVLFADAHPDLDPVELADQWAQADRLDRYREPLLDRARTFAAVTLEPAWADLDDTAIEAELLDELRRCFDLDDAGLLDAGVHAFRAERSRILDQHLQETS